MDVRFKMRSKIRIHMRVTQIGWWNLKGKQKSFQYKILKGGFKHPQGCANDMWNKIVQEIIKVDKEMSRRSRDFGTRGKELWWWNENVQSKVKVKR